MGASLWLNSSAANDDNVPSRYDSLRADKLLASIENQELRRAVLEHLESSRSQTPPSYLTYPIASASSQHHSPGTYSGTSSGTERPSALNSSNSVDSAKTTKSPKRRIPLISTVVISSGLLVAGWSLSSWMIPSGVHPASAVAAGERSPAKTEGHRRQIGSRQTM